MTIHITVASTDAKWHQDCMVLGEINKCASVLQRREIGSRMEMEAERWWYIAQGIQSLSSTERWVSCFQLCPLLSLMTRDLPGSHPRKKSPSESTRHLIRSSSSSFPDRSCTCHAEMLPQRWLFWKQISPGGAWGQRTRARVPRSQCQRALTWAGPAPASLLTHPSVSCERSHFVWHNGMQLLKCQGFFTNDTSIFPDQGRGSPHLFALLQLCVVLCQEETFFFAPHATLSWSSAAASLSSACQCPGCINAAGGVSWEWQPEPLQHWSTAEAAREGDERSVQQQAECRLPSLQALCLWFSSLKFQRSSRTVWRNVLPERQVGKKQEVNTGDKCAFPIWVEELK